MNFILVFVVHVFGESVSINPRSVNLALDTIIEFDNKDGTDLQIIDNVQEVLDKIKNILTDNSGRRSMNNNYKFTNFLIKFLDIISYYEDDDLEDVVTVIDDEIRKYHYAGCRFFELLHNNDMRKFVGSKLDEIKGKAPDDLRHDIKHILSILKTRENDNTKEFLDYINTLYPIYSRDKLKNFINNIEIYKSKSKRANLDLIKIVREGLRRVIFDHYTNLNVNARKDLRIRLETFWKSFMDPYKVEHKIWNMRYTKSDNHSRHVTTKNVSPVSREGNYHTNNKNEIHDFQSTTLKYFDGFDLTTKTEKIREDINQDVRSVYKDDIFPVVVDESTKTVKTTNSFIFSTYKDIVSQLNLGTDKQLEIKPSDKSVFGQLNDDVTSKSFIKDFEKSINLNFQDIPAIVKQKFDSLTKERLLKTKKDVFNYKNVDIDITTKRIVKKVKKNKNKDKHRNSKRLSIVTTQKSTELDRFYDSEEIININDKKTIKPIKKPTPKPKTKQKQKKESTSSRLLTLFVEEYTGKVNKNRNKHKTTSKHRKHTTWKGADNHRKKDKKKRVSKNRFTYVESDRSSKKTIKAQDHKDHRYENRNKHHKKYQTHQKYSIKSGKTTKTSRKWFRLPTTESYEGISIESFTSRSYRKKIDFDEFLNQTTLGQKKNYITKANLTLPKITSEINTTGSENKIQLNSFGPLDFWQGTTKYAKNTTQETSVLPSPSKMVGNINTTIRTINYNDTIKKANDKDILKNGTIRPIDLENISTNLPNTITRQSTTKGTKPSTVKSTIHSKPFIKKTSPPSIKRRIEDTTLKQTTILTEITKKNTNSNITKPTFNLGQFLNESEVLNLEDKRKKDEIHEKILKDMRAVFSPTTTSTTVKSFFTDAFDEIENALNLD